VPLSSPLLLAALSGCGSPAPADPAAERATYRAALTEPDAEAAVARCATLVDPMLRGDCVVGVMQLTGDRDPAHCAQVPADSPFFAECWFTAADDPDLPLDARWGRCAPAGHLGPECRQHQRGREAARIGEGDAPVPDKVARVAALVARDRHRDDAVNGFVDRTWYALWLGHHKRAGRTSLAVCEGLADAADPCRAATDQLIEHTVRQAVRADPGRCAEPVEALASLRAGAGPALGDEPAVLARAEGHRARACRPHAR